MSVLPSIMSGQALTSLTAIPTVAEGDTARSNAKSMPPYPYGWRLRSRLCLMPCLDASASYFHRCHSTHRLIPRHCHEDSGVPLLYTPQTSPLGATKCITQRDYQIRHFLIVLALCQSKEYAVIRFHRHGFLSPVSLQYQQTDFNLLAGANVCGPGYSLAF